MKANVALVQADSGCLDAPTTSSVQNLRSIAAG
jgi:hypothetical protein